MQISHARRGARILGLALAALAIAVPAAQAAKPSKDVPVQLLGINDFHGNLEPPTGTAAASRWSAAARRSMRAALSTSPRQLRTLRGAEPATR